MIETTHKDVSDHFLNLLWPKTSKFRSKISNSKFHGKPATNFGNYAKYRFPKVKTWFFRRKLFCYLKWRQNKHSFKLFLKNFGKYFFLLVQNGILAGLLGNFAGLAGVLAQQISKPVPAGKEPLSASLHSKLDSHLLNANLGTAAFTRTWSFPILSRVPLPIRVWTSIFDWRIMIRPPLVLFEADLSGSSHAI